MTVLYFHDLFLFLPSIIPTDALFDAVAAGRLLILSSWPYDPSKKLVSREECVAMNSMAEEICNALSPNCIRKN